ncbi:MAG: glutamate--tRNA ligase [Candidatus Yanofskybacteria bacterium]|nr:glutamate--tRNA ligase [Candidatus Yanofskybacteria bacterium]
MKVKVRIAPSPTGFLHIGTAQSALYNWLFARKNGGTFHLRIEDTDRERSTKEYEHSILYALEWLGLNWDGEVVRQSQHGIKYRKALERLITEGKAFWCNHTKEELESERKEQGEKKEPPRHICSHRNNAMHYPASSPQRINDWVLRLAVDRDVQRKIIFDDIIRGRIEFDASLLGDFSIAKSLDDALYNFAVVVDDIDMGITHVIRGEDHISNTPKQILIYEALGKEIPKFAHLPLILAPDRSKLSKRHGAVAVVDYKRDYLPEALLNFLGAMSHTFSKELLTKEEMIEEFELSKVHKSGAVFNTEKLNWFNSQYIKKLEPSKFLELAGIDVPEKAIPLITERLEKLSDVQNFDYFWKEPEYDKELLKWKEFSLEESKKSLEESSKILEKTENNEAVRSAFDELGQKLGNRGLAYWPLRVALTGKEKSPDPIDIAFVLGKEKTLERVKKAIRSL